MAVQLELGLSSKPVMKVAAIMNVRNTGRGPQILLAERANGEFTFPGGKMEKDEKLKQAAFRELAEEGVGIKEPVIPLSPVLLPTGVEISGYLKMNSNKITLKQSEPDKLGPWEWKYLHEAAALVANGLFPLSVWQQWIEKIPELAAEMKFKKELKQWKRRYRKGEIPAWMLVPEPFRDFL
jgi:hypothetical protein